MTGSMTHLRLGVSALAYRNGRVPVTTFGLPDHRNSRILQPMQLDHLALNKHWFEFLQKRVQEDFALPQHIMSCRTPVDFWSVYMQFPAKGPYGLSKGIC